MARDRDKRQLLIFDVDELEERQNCGSAIQLGFNPFRMQTLRNPLSIFRARSQSRERSNSQAGSNSEKSEKSRTRSELSNKKSKPTTQKLFVKRDKNASECLAETKIEKKSYCKEKTNKSITLPQPKMFVCEKIEKTVRIPNEQMGKKSTKWNYVPSSSNAKHNFQPGASTSASRLTTSFCTEQMIDEIFAPLRDTIKKGIDDIRHSSSSPEKVKSLNHTPSTRLEQWKAQLVSGATKSRDNSAPAPVQRISIRPKNTQLNIPRRLHVTKSATNATHNMDHRTLKDANVRPRSGTWQPFGLHTTNFDRPPVDFITSPRNSQPDGIFKPIACRPKVADYINHNDSNKKSFRKIDSIIRSDSKESNGSFSDLLLIYQGKDSNVEMNSSIRSTASNSSSFPIFISEQNNQQKTTITTLSSSSSGIHVTPSPSDSGIIDYENLIRDKEMELQEIRTTMEQNEEIIIKVYQDKERAWETELEGLKCRVSASEKGEKALREQLSNCQRQNAAMSSCMRTVQEEKNRLMSKCIQLEKDIEYLRKAAINRFCPNCSFNQNNEEKDLRREVKDLRREVANLKRYVDDGIHFK